MSEKALRFNAGKVDLTYLLEFPKAMRLFVNICKMGEAKYGRNNFKLGGKEDLEYFKSCLRHLQDGYTGVIHDQDVECDDDSGLYHLGHAIWNLIALVELNIPEERLMRFDSQAEFLEFCDDLDEKYRPMREEALAKRDEEAA